jgi:glutaredoxin/glutathione-dependent peroxiredoxin
MTLAVGERLPPAPLSVMGADGPETVNLEDRLKGRKVVVFALPGAFTGPCTTAHVPSFIRTADAFRAKGVEEIICIAVNDPFVLKAWGESTGATAAGITMLGANRYALVIEDGVIRVSNVDEPATCKISVGEELACRLGGRMKRRGEDHRRR